MRTDTIILAKDALSARTYDSFGRMHISKTNISKATVNPYYGREVPGAAALGLEPDKLYYFLRDPKELERGASTFARMPILSKHVPVNTKIFPKEIVIGGIGSDVAYDHPYLQADVSLWTDEAIAGIETDTVREWSCSYKWTPVMQSGMYEGVYYDGIMTNIEGNHLILTESGRAGSDVMAADAALEIQKMTKLGKALVLVLGNMSAKLAADSALPGLVGQADKKTFKKSEITPKLLAMDSDLENKDVDDVIDAIMDVENNPEPTAVESEEKPVDGEKKPVAKDDEPTDKRGKLSKMLSGKLNDDELAAVLGVACDDDSEDDEDDMITAMDSFKKDLRDAHEARLAVRDVVGDVAMDSAPEIYGFALDQMGVKREGVTELAGLRSLFVVAKDARSAKPATAIVAMDTATLTAQFPDANRVRQA